MTGSMERAQLDRPDPSWWGFEAPWELRASTSGLINATWWLLGAAGEPRAVLQRLNTRIFRPEVHLDLAAVTEHLAEKGLPTPRLILTRTGAGWWTDADGGVWRALTPVGDRTLERLPDARHAEEAGALVGRFHAALRDYHRPMVHVRPGAHDTEGHYRRLQTTLGARRDHPLWAAVAALAEELGAAWRGFGPLPALPLRVVHGDLKCSNLRFLGDQAWALVDLDTLAYGTLDVELGDALRSWCNPHGEDQADPEFRVDLLEAALTGYRSAFPDLTKEERAALVPGCERIALELSMRFAEDALSESYFRTNPAYGRPGEHNLLRARGQAALARAVRAWREA